VSEPKRDTLAVPGAVLHYDVRANDASAQPVLLLIGSPMGADGFAELAGCFDDRTVVTYDPRGVGAASEPTAPAGPHPGSMPTTCTG
jgi:pimeloyl-ACP methyl ester carboxylesterase